MILFYGVLLDLLNGLMGIRGIHRGDYYGKIAPNNAVF